LFRKGIDKSIVLKTGLPAVVFVLIGALLTGIIPAVEIELLLNIILVLLSIYLILFFNRSLKKTDFNLFIGGCTSGFLAGLVGTGGAIRGITLSAFHLPKEIFVATSAMIDLGVDVSRSVVYIWQGYFPSEYLLLIPFLILISATGSFLGKKILRYTTEKTFRYIVLAVVLLTSGFQLINYFIGG
jgi:hypothetical protein